MTSPLIIDVHLLQSLPYSNINRDDLGSPKQMVYGGTERTRVSSQSWKRVTRHAVEAAVGQEAMRTRHVPQEVSERLQRRGWSKDLADAAGAQVLISAVKASPKKEGLKTDEEGRSSALLYLPTAALDELADLAEQHRGAIEAKVGQSKPTAALPWDRVAQVLATTNATIHLFGRMLAELPGADVDGAVQVAHAFTTHTTTPEIDFFTAVDDRSPAEVQGSAHMNSAEFSAGVFYRYANVDVRSLHTHVGATDPDMAETLVRQFLRAFATSMPTGKQRSTAAQTLPDLIHVAVRSDRPVSFAGAFEAPVRADESGYAKRSREHLSLYATQMRRLWGADDIMWDGYADIDASKLEGLGAAKGSFRELIDQAVGAAFGQERQ
ncbi:type I-E CRISPR-associated protein Cas7/Cse4/CasC [Nocardia sp. CNY236]|uniref:type I-E CRISPR-associated protein Cas7/Cse4/CasC n=1 Tax=Nocardia sp. CNY236 TaxID=1169152 RepID=UPI0004259CF1|nr:type I-E CRISPR-associated protein Cas7/Cse4/CasC [Nocardia sp. CNY236]